MTEVLLKSDVLTTTVTLKMRSRSSNPNNHIAFSNIIYMFNVNIKIIQPLIPEKDSDFLAIKMQK